MPPVRVAALCLALAGCTGVIGGDPLGTGKNGPDAAASTAASPGCAQGQIACGDVCADVSSDPLHCGQCGTRCDAGRACVGGQCQIQCAQGEIDCGGACANVVSDPKRCGTCDTVCPAGQICAKGVCSAICAFDTCEGVGGVSLCVDTRTDPSHCGACGAACPAGRSCLDGVCVVSCPSGRTACADQCVSLSTDALHCGSCDRACSALQSCIQGACGCPSGRVQCGGECVDTATSAQHCGGCNAPCPAGAGCSAGACQCPSGTALCSGTCVDTAASPNCGGCGVVCPSGQICDQGACKPQTAGCAGTTSLCGTSCVDTQTSNLHCGRCDAPCPAGQTCVAGACACPGGRSICAGACFDLQTDNMNCGGCGTTCTGGSSCSAGACACPAALTLCNGVCVDMQTSMESCGTCGTACAVGQSCAAGKCTCPGGATNCNGKCTDTQTDDNNCGTCAETCEGGSHCVAGTCTCPTDQTMCSGQCVDTKSSTTSCGGCDKPCAAGQSCTNGACTGGGIGEDGCSNDLGRGVALKEIAVYQSVKISIMSGMTEVAKASRKADIVAARDTMVRVFVTVDAGWTARELSARLTLTSDQGAAQNFYSKKTITKSSVENDLTTTFQIFVSPEVIVGTLRYSIEVVECTSQTGTAGQARFPATGDLDIGLRTVGGLVIKVIPFSVNNLVPDTSETALGVYAAEMKAMYPSDVVSISVGDTLTTTSPVSWTGMLDQVRTKRRTDAPAADVYYYGLVKPADTFRAYCGTGCTTGIGYVTGVTSASQRAAVGVGYADRASAQTMAHEIGHNHGRNHAPCAGGGTISGVDANYPYANGALGSWGYDARTKALIDPTKSTDLMGYCSNKWVSDYTYKGLTERVAAVNAATMLYFDASQFSRWRVLILEATGPRWGIPIDEPSPAEGVPENATVYDAQNRAIATVAVYRTEIGDANASMVLVPEPSPGWYAIGVAGVAALPFAAPRP